MLRNGFVVLFAASLLVGVLDPSSVVGTGSNMTSLEERVASLEQNITIMQRQLDVALARSAHLFDEVEDLQHLVKLLEANTTRLSRFALPSRPAYFKVERIRKTKEGSYSVSLRWRNNAPYEKVTDFVIWHAPKGGKYIVDATVNQTDGKIQRAVISGFKEGEEIVFKIFAKNDAGQSEPTYVETKIRGYAPYLLRKVEIAGGIILLAALGLFLLKRTARGGAGGQG